MAGPVTHIVFAEKLFRDFQLTHNKKSFMVGTSFPDIRYLKVIDREAAHPHVSSLQEIIREADPFIAGQKLHAFLDLKREEYLSEKGLYDLVDPNVPYMHHAIKTLEDQMFYEKVSDWLTVADYFDHLDPGEQEFEIPAIKIGKWHGILQDYFLVPPSEESVTRFTDAVRMPEGTGKEIFNLVEELKVNGEVTDILEGMYDNLDLEGDLKEEKLVSA